MGTKDVIRNGSFKFSDRNAKNIEEFNLKTPFDKKIEQWISVEINPWFIMMLNKTHKLLHSSRENGNGTFGSLIAIQVADACEKLFKSSLVDDVLNSYAGFVCQREHRNNDDGLIDFSISLLNMDGVRYMALEYFEEKPDTAKMKQVCEQTNRYCQELFEDQTYLGKWANSYSSVCCILINQQEKNLRFVKFTKATKDSLGFNDVIQYSNVLGLFKLRTTEFDVQEVSFQAYLIVYLNIYPFLLFCFWL